jgi:signal transduction histidine kinase
MSLFSASPSVIAVTPAAPATTALAQAWRRLLPNLPRGVLVMSAMCGLIALALNDFQISRIGTKLVYSFVIGFCCWIGNLVGRLLLAWLVDRWRQHRGLAPSAEGFGSGWGPIVVGSVLGLLVGPPIGLFISDALTGYTSPSLWRLDSNVARITLTLSLLGSLVGIYLFSNMERLAQVRTQAEAAQRLAAENQLQLLQSQLEPHMLFNTLANLRVLIGLDPARAQAMLDHLIAFLRATLMASRQPLHALQAEFAHLADYLALMTVRMGPRLQVAFDLPAELAALPVPPLLLQPLVENAIKHGLEPKLAGGRIIISARRDGSSLHLTVRDTGVGLHAAATTAGTSFGLEQVRSRLQALHNGQASLTLQAADDAEGGTVAHIQLPVSAARP